MGRVVQDPLDGQLDDPVRVPVRVQAIHQVGRVADAVGGEQVERVHRELPGRRAVAADGRAEPFEDRLGLDQLVLLLGTREAGRRTVRVPVGADLMARGDDVAHPVGVHLGDTAGHEERRRQAAAVEQAKQLGHTDVGAVGAHREQPRLRRGVRVARQPHLLGIEVEREGDGAAGARRPGHGTTTAGAARWPGRRSPTGTARIRRSCPSPRPPTSPSPGGRTGTDRRRHGIDLPPAVGRPERAGRPTRGIDDAPLRLELGDADDECPVTSSAPHSILPAALTDRWSSCVISSLSIFELALALVVPVYWATVDESGDYVPRIDPDRTRVFEDRRGRRRAAGQLPASPPASR